MSFAFAELRRRPGKFALTACALTLLVALLLFLGGLLDGLFLGSTGALESQRGELIVFSAAARGQLVRSRVTPDVRTIVEGVPGVRRVSGLGVSLVGARPPDNGDFLDAAVFGYEGGVRGVPAPPPEGQAWVDSTLRKHGVRTGSTIRLGRGAVPVRVRGFVHDTSYLLQGGVWVAPPTWRLVARTNRPDQAVAPGVFSALVVTPASGTSAPALARRIDRSTGGATSTLTKHDAIYKIPGVKEQEGTFRGIINMTFAISAIVVALFFALLVLERTRLFGVFKAIGASSIQLVSGVLLQAVVLSLLALAVGGALVLLLAPVLRQAFPFTVTPARGTTVAIGVLAASTLGALISLRRIVRIDPASAIGGS